MFSLPICILCKFHYIMQISFSEVSAKKPNSTSSSSQNSSIDSQIQKRRLLVVDDENDLREVIAFDFNRKGYEVHTAEGGKEAWKKLNLLTVDLVITDIKMPEGDGIELLSLIKAKFPQLPVICLTGFAELSQDEMIKLGATAVFEKPFERKKLHEAVETGIVQSKSTETK
jgi:two-component system response regulator (stage 0 sporulation protein F)